MPWPKGTSQRDPKATEVIVRWYVRIGSTRKVATQVRCSRATVIRHLHSEYGQQLLRDAGVSIRPAGRPS